jgi:large subunit ribosomal protein L25
MQKQDYYCRVREKVSSGANRRLRSRGYIPAVIYGKGMEPVSVAVKKTELEAI